MEQGKILDYKPNLCPFSGIGKPPHEWSCCAVQCALFDGTTGMCAFHSLWHARELSAMKNVLDGMKNSILSL